MDAIAALRLVLALAVVVFLLLFWRAVRLLRVSLRESTDQTWVFGGEAGEARGAFDDLHALLRGVQVSQHIDSELKLARRMGWMSLAGVALSLVILATSVVALVGGETNTWNSLTTALGTIGAFLSAYAFRRADVAIRRAGERISMALETAKFATAYHIARELRDKERLAALQRLFDRVLGLGASG
jgi:hypothetical protein